MDAINKLLGSDVYANGAGSFHQDKTSKKTGNLTGTNVNKRQGVSSHDLVKSAGANGSQRTRKSWGKGQISKEDYSTSVKSEHPHIVDETRFKTVFIPGKRGGTFQLPFDASITIPEGCFGKKDELTCQAATPQTRWHTCPANLSSNEHVNSEIYTFTSTLHHALKNNLFICIPFIPINSEFNEIHVKVKWTGHIEWGKAGYLIKEIDNRPYVELEVNRFGTFLVTTTPKTEMFDVTPQGCLYQARLSHHITTRFPKKAVLKDIQCSLQILPIPEEKVQLSREQYLTDSANIIAVTEFVDIIANVECQFARPVTIKLPLPVAGDADAEEKDAAAHKRHQDIAVLHKTNAGWELIESAYKFTQTTVCFDVKELSRFCVMQCVPGRQKKMKDAITLLEGRSEKEKGEICLFLSIKNKSWLALVEVFPQHLAGAKISGRISQGFTVVTRTEARNIEAASFRFSNRRHHLLTKSTPLDNGDESFDLHEGLTWYINIEGDLRVSSKSDLRENAELRYFARFNESYRTFFFEPSDMDPRPLTAYVNLAPVRVSDENLRKLTITFKIEVEESTMVDFLVPDSPRETVPEERISEKPKDLNLGPVSEPAKIEPTPPPPPTPKLKEVQANVMKRLTHVRKPIGVLPHISIFERPMPTVLPAERESRAITGKSLMTLAKLVPEGLTLAVHLQLPDSTITGIGFDALSNNLTMSDVTYKILLHWKRTCKDKQMGAIRQLAHALREMNYHIIAEAIFNCHLSHKEFTRDCISLSKDEDITSVNFR